MYVQEVEPVAGSLGLSALVAALPLLIVLVLLGGVRMKAHLAALLGLLAAALVALFAYGMPVGQTLSSAAQEPPSASSPSCGSSSTPCGCTG